MRRRDMLKSTAALSIIGVGEVAVPLRLLAADELARRVRLVVNDIEPQVISASPAYRLLSCKDLVRLRNAFAGYSDERILLDPGIDTLYQRLKSYQSARLADYKVRLKTIQGSWNQQELDSLKYQRTQYWLGVGCAATIILAGLLAATFPITSLVIVSAVTIYSLADATYQLFHIENQSGAIESVVFFSDAKFSGLSVLSTQLGDKAAGTALERLNSRSWGVLSWLFLSYGIYRTYSGIDRIERLKQLVEFAKIDFESAQSDAENVLRNKKQFVEHLRLASGQAAAAVERIWTNVGVNDCALSGTIPLSTLIKPQLTGPTLRPLP